MINKLHRGDCVEIMRSMPDESVDLVVTSPPYNLMNTHRASRSHTPSITWQKAPLSNGYDGHDDRMPHDEYVPGNASA